MQRQWKSLQKTVGMLLLIGTVPAWGAANLQHLLEEADPAHAAQGWIQLFDHWTRFGWTGPGLQDWQIRDRELVCTGLEHPSWIRTTTEFAQFELVVEFQKTGTGRAYIGIRTGEKLQGPSSSGYWIPIADTDPEWPTGSIRPTARAAGLVRTEGKWSTIRIRADETFIRVWCNGKAVCESRTSRFRRGFIALGFEPGNAQARFAVRTVELRPLGMTSLFNGKDLTGWKPVPGRPAVYFVNSQGWLCVTNGPGDLQTTKTFKDFVLQLQIRVNGTHLNSGVFFRAIPGQFWAGYESQIRNQWRDQDRTRPVDYGTGGIYNRQPARIVLSSDQEWFTKTIVMHGRHIAVWVNGIQVSDWTDPRPPNPNPRRGYRALPGVISLQGHDPTTNLCFRNIRIVELR